MAGISPRVGGRTLTTDAELRQAFHTAPAWWRRLQLRLRREPHVVISFPERDGLAEAIVQRIFDPEATISQSLRSAATTALTRSIRPRATGKPRPSGNPPKTVTPLMHAVRRAPGIAEMIAIIDAARIVHHRRALNQHQRTALVAMLQPLHQSRRSTALDWRDAVRYGLTLK